MDELYRDPAPERAQLDAQPGVTVLEFGAPWCGHCQAAQPLIQQALAECPGVRHLQIEDGPGRRLGRSYRVKLWPTLIFLRHGQEAARLTRPDTAAAVSDALRQCLPPEEHVYDIAS
ncbi:thioredoxin family protein [Chromobacterium haemolyticum]|uniref:thioredoxin family protein n=1 Tax=Chromobacterium haemolyticum TaxID=394935 RepID=UPI00030550FA|nr:thioredoxin family protein [Chromobacterium haemolyticum]MDH0340548.1 thioredoxin family protein [Chromobacterium haemolyticum]QOD84252.1 thioredoxin family protein [Chromobacterium haemolyticum]BBH12245.1 thiol reductase thioredoxin [Chromobacterium haemolyticum]